MDNKTDSDDNNSNGKLFLDINRGDYARELKSNELWQKDAYDKICELLKNSLEEIKHYESNKSENENKVHMHDAIFISGARGTGKTAFLHNIERYWNSPENENKTS